MTFQITIRQTLPVWRNMETRSYNHFCGGKSISITYTENVFVALGIQHAMLMRHIVIWGLSGSTVFFHTWPETFLILIRNQWDMIRNVYWSARELPVIVVRFNANWIFSTDFRHILKFQISWKSALWEPNRSVRKDRRTDGHIDLTNILVAFRSFADSRKNSWRNRTTGCNIRDPLTLLPCCQHSYSLGGFQVQSPIMGIYRDGYCLLLTEVARTSARVRKSALAGTVANCELGWVIS
jgi:hypothetical protein